MDNTQVVLLLAHPILLPLHPLQLICVELALQVIIKSHQTVCFLLQLIDPRQFFSQLIDLQSFLVLILQQLFNALFHLLDYLLIHLALLGDHVQFKFELSDLASLFFDCAPQIIVRIWRQVGVLLSTSNVLSNILSFELQQLFPKVLVLLSQTSVLFCDAFHFYFHLLPFFCWSWQTWITLRLLDLFLFGFWETDEVGGRLICSDTHRKRQIFGRLCLCEIILWALRSLQIVWWFIDMLSPGDHYLFGKII